MNFINPVPDVYKRQIIINNPQGVYYGGTIAAPVCRDLFSNILPYLGIEQAPVTEDAEIQENP